MNIYNWEKDQKVQLELLEKSDIPTEYRETLLRFIRSTKREKNITVGREITLLRLLRVQAEQMKGSFLDPGKKEIEDLVDAWDSSDLKKGTVNLKKQIAKQFYKWHYEDNLEKELPKYIKKGIRQNQKRSEEQKPDTLTDEQVEKLIEACPSSRDKCLIALLNDSGMRVGEALGIKIKDVQQEDYGMKIQVRSGKTGFRSVIVAGRSVIYIKRWLNEHPYANNMDSYLFVELNNGHNAKQGEPLKHYIVNSIMIRLRERTGIRVYAHMFRHSAASRLAGVVPEAILERQFGWITGSRMSSVYVKTNDAMQENAILSGLGIKHTKSVEPYKPLKCGRCGQLNEKDAKYCHNCLFPLTTEEALEREKKEDKVTRAVSDLVSSEQRTLLQNLPESAKLDALAVLLKDLESRGMLDMIRQRIKVEEGNGK
jgi:integrase